MPWRRWRRHAQVACAPALVGAANALPQFIDYAELYKYDGLGWLLVENLIAVDDRCAVLLPLGRPRRPRAGV